MTYPELKYLFLESKGEILILIQVKIKIECNRLQNKNLKVEMFH